MMALNSPSETPSVRDISFGSRTGRELASLTAVEKNTLREPAHLSPVLLEHTLAFNK